MHATGQRQPIPNPSHPPAPAGADCAARRSLSDQDGTELGLRLADGLVAERDTADEERLRRIAKPYPR
jgi:hypothetical protein